jgi:hypothetical protein
VFLFNKPIYLSIYVDQDKSVSDLQTLIKYSFLLYFPRELLMSFLNVYKETEIIAGSSYYVF